MVPEEAIINQYSAIDIYNENTGEIYIESGQIIDDVLLEKINKENLENINIIDINSRIGPYIRNTLMEADKTSSELRH